MTKRKPRRNPKRTCLCCKKKIFGKQKSAIYCKECYEIRDYIRKLIFMKLTKIRKKYPNYNINSKLNLKITKKSGK